MTDDPPHGELALNLSLVFIHAFPNIDIIGVRFDCRLNSHLYGQWSVALMTRIASLSLRCYSLDSDHFSCLGFSCLPATFVFLSEWCILTRLSLCCTTYVVLLCCVCRTTSITTPCIVCIVSILLLVELDTLHQLSWLFVTSSRSFIMIISIIINIIFIIIIEKGRQSMAGWERFTPCQSKDPSPTIETKDKKGVSSFRPNKKALALLLKPTSPIASNAGSVRSFQRDTERGIKVLQYCEVLQRVAHEYIDVRPKHRV